MSTLTMRKAGLRMIGKRLYKLRKAAGLSQKELGDLLAVSHHTISSYEKDKSDPNDEIKIKLAKYFRVSVDYLVGMIDDPYPSWSNASIVVLPENITPEQRSMISDFVAFLSSRS